jgi:ribosome modulation factor
VTEHVPLVDKVAAAKAAAGSRGFAVTFTGPAAEANIRGSVDGMAGRPKDSSRYRTLVERESYDYGYDEYYRPPRDRRGYTYVEALF